MGCPIKFADLDCVFENCSPGHAVIQIKFLHQVDWALTMNAASQLLFFQKVRSLFARATVGIPIQAKKKYRLNPDELARVRNVCCLFSQVFPTLATKIPQAEGARVQQDFVDGTSMDDDWYPFLDSRPKRISLSMLRSRKEEAKKLEQEKQQMIHSEVAQQREAVTSAQWNFFCSGLKQDQALLEKLTGVPAQLRAKLHAKQVSMRKEQSIAGEKATKGYQERGFETPVLFLWFS